MGEAWEEGGVRACCRENEGEGLEEECKKMGNEEWVV